MKGLFPLFYFSGTGNTWWVSQRLAEKLGERGLQARAYSIEQIEPQAAGELISAAQGVGLGFPTYGSDAPRNFTAWLKALPAQEQKKPLLGFITQLGWSGDGCNFLEGLFREKGLDLKWAAEFNMPDSICLPAFPFFPYQSDLELIAPMLKEREKEIDALCDKIIKGEGWRQHNDLFSWVSAWIQRGPFRLGHDWGRKFWSVDGEKCLGERCGRCARICPVGNIRMEGGAAVHAEACVYCMRCFNYCPTYSIHYMGKSNEKLIQKPPYRGPVQEFKPELICRKERKKN